MIVQTVLGTPRITSISLGVCSDRVSTLITKDQNSSGAETISQLLRLNVRERGGDGCSKSSGSGLAESGRSSRRGSTELQPYAGNPLDAKVTGRNQRVARNENSSRGLVRSKSTNRRFMSGSTFPKHLSQRDDSSFVPCSFVRVLRAPSSGNGCVPRAPHKRMPGQVYGRRFSGKHKPGKPGGNLFFHSVCPLLCHSPNPDLRPFLIVAQQLFSCSQRVVLPYCQLAQQDRENENDKEEERERGVG